MIRININKSTSSTIRSAIHTVRHESKENCDKQTETMVNMEYFKVWTKTKTFDTNKYNRVDSREERGYEDIGNVYESPLWHR